MPLDGISFCKRMGSMVWKWSPCKLLTFNHSETTFYCVLENRNNCRHQGGERVMREVKIQTLHSAPHINHLSCSWWVLSSTNQVIYHLSSSISSPTSILPQQREPSLSAHLFSGFWGNFLKINDDSQPTALVVSQQAHTHTHMCVCICGKTMTQLYSCSFKRSRSKVAIVNTYHISLPPLPFMRASTNCGLNAA